MNRKYALILLGIATVAFTVILELIDPSHVSRGEDCGEISQRDTYFAVQNGGLKLREEQPGRPHLMA